MNYHFDKATSMLDYTAKDPGSPVLIEYKYLLQGDTFTLQEELLQEQGSAPKTLFKAGDNAKKE